MRLLDDVQTRSHARVCACAPLRLTCSVSNLLVPALTGAGGAALLEDACQAYMRSRLASCKGIQPSVLATMLLPTAAGSRARAALAAGSRRALLMAGMTVVAWGEFESPPKNTTRSELHDLAALTGVEAIYADADIDLHRVPLEATLAVLAPVRAFDAQLRGLDLLTPTTDAPARSALAVRHAREELQRALASVCAPDEATPWKASAHGMHWIRILANAVVARCMMLEAWLLASRHGSGSGSGSASACGAGSAATASSAPASYRAASPPPPPYTLIIMCDEPHFTCPLALKPLLSPRAPMSHDDRAAVNPLGSLAAVFVTPDWMLDCVATQTLLDASHVSYAHHAWSATGGAAVDVHA